jgi:hypothetical protein
MPTGRVRWFAPDTGEARIVARSGREYPASSGEIEPKARAADARVTFKVRTDGGVTRAVEVRLREGTRVARAQGRFGDLSGARRPDAKGRSGLTRRRSDADLDAAEPASRVTRRWVDALVRGDREAVLRLYSPDCVVHTPSGSTETGDRAVQASIDRNALLGSGHLDVEIREVGPRVLVRWRLSADDQARVPGSDQRTQAALRIAHGQIIEQWD